MLHRLRWQSVGLYSVPFFSYAPALFSFAVVAGLSYFLMKLFPDVAPGYVWLFEDSFCFCKSVDANEAAALALAKCASVAAKCIIVPASPKTCQLLGNSF